jgi:hypothetical protein
VLEVTLKERLDADFKDAMKKREQQAKDAHDRLTKATAMYAKLNTLFGHKIGTVVDMSKLDEKKEAKPMALRALWFKPDKAFDREKAAIVIMDSYHG